MKDKYFKSLINRVFSIKLHIIDSTGPLKAICGNCLCIVDYDQDDPSSFAWEYFPHHPGSDCIDSYKFYKELLEESKK